jgi:hypothetical protein
MSKSLPSSITIEEAVAFMVNMDYIPTGFTLEDMLSAFEEEAETEYENALSEHLSNEKIATLKIRLDACVARHSLALLLLQDLRNEISNPHDSDIILSNEKTSVPRYTLESISDWVADRYGIGISEQALIIDNTESKEPEPDVNWNDITIKIRANNRIAYSTQKGKYKEKTFQDIGFIHKTRNTLTQSAVILIGLSQGKKFPTSANYQPKDKTAISKTRRSLEKLTGLTKDPFAKFNKIDGWKPLFILIDDRNNADERAKNQARHESYDDSINHRRDIDDTDDGKDNNE